MMENHIQCADPHLVETFSPVPAGCLIGITGKAGSGKDTIGDHLWEHGYRRISFATPLKKALVDMFSLRPEHLDHPLKEQVLPEFGKSPRQLMQTLATEWGRNLVHPDLWLMLAKARIEALWREGFAVVITDVRFENEAAMIRILGGKIWHVRRAGAGTPHGHISEAGILFHPGQDDLISNDGTLGDLYAAIDQLVGELSN